ncbi:hypothetical protein NEMBOFW57_010780 [Staphylotrichum longicolle]|uniref:Uncharacterized protein n=1 Tax=Staphylotrichum longicolle TaxID=669026 RepID=A0AAD4ES38_9PEZI|nr:hypothetical protein NEMBOFW57_010780 [Staphylotrichum longicolle]
MADPVVDFEIEDDSGDSCVIVGDREVLRSRRSTASKKGQPATKRSRGRPRKQRNNTIDTAIVLSDADDDDYEDDDDNDDDGEENGRALKAPQKGKKRGLTKVESPTPAPKSKRTASSRAVSATSQTAAASTVRADVDRLQQQLASEKKKRADAEAQKSELQRLLDEKEASWAADLAAQSMPLQLQLQRFAKEKRELDAANQDLETRLQASLSKNQEQCTSAESVTSAPLALNIEDLEAQIHDKDSLINTQSADMAKLKENDAARIKELADAKRKIVTLAETLDGLTTRHDAATKMIVEHESRIQHLTHELSEAKNWPDIPDDVPIAIKTLAETKKRLVQAERQNAGSKATVADLQRKLAASKDARTKVERMLNNTDDRLATAQSQVAEKEKRLAAVEAKLAATETQLETAKGNLSAVEAQLRHAQQATSTEAQAVVDNQEQKDATMTEDHKVSLIKISNLEEAVAKLENEKLLWVKDFEEKNLLQKELNEHKTLVASMHQKGQELRALLAAAPPKKVAELEETVAALEKDKLQWSKDSSEKTILQQQLEEHKSLVLALQDKEQDLRAALAASPPKISQLEEIVAALEKEKLLWIQNSSETAILEQKLAEQKASFASLQKKEQEKTIGLEERIAVLEGEKLQWTAAINEKKALEQELQNHKNLVSHLQFREQELEISAAATADDLAALRHQLSEQANTLAALQAENHHLASSQATTTQQLAALEHALTTQKSTTINLQHAHTTLLKEHRSALGRVTALQTTLSTRDTELGALHKDHESALARLNALQITLTSPDTELSASKTELASLKDKLERGKVAFTADMQVLATKLRDARRVVEERGREAEQLEQTVAALRDDVARAEGQVVTYRDECQAKNALLARQEGLVAAAQGQVALLRQAVEGVAREKEGLMKRVEEMKRERQGWEERLEKFKREVEGLRRQLDMGQTMAAAEKEEMKKLMAQSDKSAVTVERLSQDLMANKEENEVLRQHISDLVAEKAAAAKVVTTLETEGQQPTARDDDQSPEATKEVAELEERIAQLTGENVELRKERDALAAEVEKLKAKFAEVKDEAEALEEDIKKRDGCLERMRGFVSSLPKWMER